MYRVRSCLNSRAEVRGISAFPAGRLFNSASAAAQLWSSPHSWIPKPGWIFLLRGNLAGADKSFPYLTVLTSSRARDMNNRKVKNLGGRPFSRGCGAWRGNSVSAGHREHSGVSLQTGSLSMILSLWKKAENHGLISHLRQMRSHRDSKGIYLKSERMCTVVGKDEKMFEVICH